MDNNNKHKGSKEVIFGKTLEQLKELVRELKMPAYTARQIADWLYKKKIAEFSQMTNISETHRRRLSERFDTGLSTPIKEMASADGTKKYLYSSFSKRFIEAAYIPEASRHTLCVSSQAGCKMGCLFCMTGKQGFQGQLSASEILNQIYSLPESHMLTNIVFMGMGEPFDNLQEVLNSLEILTADYGLAISPKRITVSTIGIIPAMMVFLEKSSCNLAISLHSPFEEERRKLMPVEKAYPIKDVIKAIKEFSPEKQRKISFEYIVFKDFNHSKLHVNELARILNGIRCRINLLRFHPIPDTALEAPTEESMQEFKAALEKKGITTTIRKSRGQDIFAACGMLSTKAV